MHQPCHFEAITCRAEASRPKQNFSQGPVLSGALASPTAALWADTLMLVSGDASLFAGGNCKKRA